MMQLTARQVRAYKGAAISILMLYLVEQRVLSQQEMRRGTGYGDESVHDAVLMLQEDGLLVQVGKGDAHSWAFLGDGERQLPIGAVEAEASPPQSELVGALKEVKEVSKTLTDDDLPCLLEEDPEKIGVDAEALAEQGFFGKGIQELLSIRGLSMREVRYQVHDTKGELSLALWRLKKRRKIPDDWERDGPSGGSDYAGGKYASFIQH